MDFRVNKNKLETFTFKNGITVVGITVDGVLNPVEYDSEIKAEKQSNRFFEIGIYTTVISLKTKPNKFYIQIINKDINELKNEGEFLTITQIIKRGLVDLNTRRLNKICKKMKNNYPEKITGGGQGKGYKIHSSILDIFQRQRKKNIK
jgi:hypothetical protein